MGCFSVVGSGLFMFHGIVLSLHNPVKGFFMIPMMPLSPSVRMANKASFASRQTPPRGDLTTMPQAQAKDTVHFSSSAGQADREFLENFFQKNATDPNVAPNVLAPQTRDEKASGIAFGKYLDNLKQGKKTFLPKSYHDPLVRDGFLKADNKSWDVERSAFRRYITEVLCKHDSPEERAEFLKVVGFKPKSKHKKTVKPAPVEMSPESPASGLPVSEQQAKQENVRKMSFDWAEEAAFAPAFVEQARLERAKLEQVKPEPFKNEVVRSGGFGEALKLLMARKTGSSTH